MTGARGKGRHQMNKLFGKVWILILAGIYFYLWTRIINDIKTVRKYYEPIKVFRHLEKFSKVWIIVHMVIIFLWSFAVWEG